MNVAVSISLISVLVCSLPTVTPSAGTPKDIKANAVSKPVVTGTALPYDGDKCAPAFLCKSDKFDD